MYICTKNTYLLQESEVIMSETEYERKERIDAVIKKILSSKENAIKFMYEAGIVDSNGKWLPIYR